MQHTLLLRSDGVVKAFGLNLDGQTDVPTLPPPGVTLGQMVVPMVMFHCPFEP